MPPEHSSQHPSKRIIDIVEDDAAVRRSLQRLLNATGFEAVAYDTAFAFLEAMPLPSDGCLLLDVRMPEMDGLELQARLNRSGFHLPVIIMTGHGDVQTVVQAMKAGAVDFIEKPFDDKALFKAIGAALGAGRADGGPDMVDAARRVAALSPREHQVLEALVAGCPNKTIAVDLGLSVRTVEVHRAHMLERLGARCLADAVRLAVMAALAKGSRGQGEPRHRLRSVVEIPERPARYANPGVTIVVDPLCGET
jgi:two-component system response regulator FixJ